jgi:hypothetical protein
MFEKLMASEYKLCIDDILNKTIYTGDSPNDAPMFRRFHLSIGVKSVSNYQMHKADLPGFITKGDGSTGFMEVAKQILQERTTK